VRLEPGAQRVRHGLLRDVQIERSRDATNLDERRDGHDRADLRSAPDADRLVVEEAARLGAAAGLGSIREVGPTPRRDAQGRANRAGLAALGVTEIDHAQRMQALERDAPRELHRIHALEAAALSPALEQPPD